jgi:hypothetical protein
VARFFSTYWPLIVGAVASIAALLAVTERTPAHPELVAQLQWGALRPTMTCPYCGTTGTVHCGRAKPGGNLSRLQATMLAFSGLWLLLALADSLKKQRMQAHCTHCGRTWDCSKATATSQAPAAKDR